MVYAVVLVLGSSKPSAKVRQRPAASPCFERRGGGLRFFGRGMEQIEGEQRGAGDARFTRMVTRDGRERETEEAGVDDMNYRRTTQSNTRPDRAIQTASILRNRLQQSRNALPRLLEQITILPQALSIQLQPPLRQTPYLSFPLKLRRSPQPPSYTS